MNMARKSLIYFIVHTAVGVAVLLLVVSGALNLTEKFANGVIWGVLGGFIVTGALGILYAVHLMRHPQKAKMAEIAKNEERTVMIRTKTHAAIFYVSLYTECAAILVTAFTGFREIALAFTVLLIIQAVCYIVFASYYAKKY